MGIGEGLPDRDVRQARDRDDLAWPGLGCRDAVERLGDV